jgi:3-hydroxyacyl-[acyl-carrier-protein] dehydratase
MAAPLAAVDGWSREPAGERVLLTARVRVRGDDPNLRGHFPGLAIFPGVFIIESLSQVVALALPASPALRYIRSVRFFAPLLDGDELTLEATATPNRDGWDVRATGVRADGTRAATLRAGFAAEALAAEAPAAEVPVIASPAGASPAGEVAGPRAHSAIRAVLPQRYPLLLVDRVLAVDPGRSIRTIKAITGTEPCYAALAEGAAGERYAYPNSLMIESFGQSAALLWLDGRAPAPDDDQVLMFVGARDYRFEAAAYPGDVLRHEVRLESVLADTAFATGATWAGDRRIATVATLIATRRPVRLSDHAIPQAVL